MRGRHADDALQHRQRAAGKDHIGPTGGQGEIDRMGHQTLVAGTAVVGGGVNRQVQCGEILQAQELRTGAPAEKHLALQGIQSAGHQVLRQKNGRATPIPPATMKTLRAAGGRMNELPRGPSTSRVSPVRRAAKRAVPLPTTL